MPVCRLTTGQCLLRSANGSLSSSRTPSSRGEKRDCVTNRKTACAESQVVTFKDIQVIQ